ncbi:alpha-amylase, partial [Vibrio cholerae HC-52A1]
MMLSDAVQFILYRYKNRRHLGRKAESIIRRIENETERLDPIAALSSSFASTGLIG